ncbi:MAG TPA: hypothetical protein DEA22_00465 [Blastocatellia bacterium]|nr:hypothetical protein [Blastocatellia bacterium]
MKTDVTKIEVKETDEISRLLGSLRRVDAPTDFNAKVMRRIAASRGESLPWRLWSFQFRFAAAAGAVVLGAVILFMAGMPWDTESALAPSEKGQTVTADSTTQPSVQGDSGEELAVQFGTSDGQDSVTSDTKFGAANGDAKREGKKAARKNEGDKQRGGSVVRALGANPDATFPKEIARPAISENGEEIDVLAALLKLGIESRYENGWTVKGIVPATPAAYVGVLEGDVVKAVNGKEIDQSTRLPAAQPIKKLSIQRNGKDVILLIGVD